jgi:uncharacterized protein
MSESENIQLLRDLYGAFHTRNVDRILEIFDEDMEWNAPVAEGIPWGGTYRGHEGVMTFFKRLMGMIDASVDPDEYVDGGEYIAAVGYSGGTVRGGSGEEFRVPAVHIWQFRDGKIVKGRAIFDVPQMRAVLEREGVNVDTPISES